MEMILIHNDLKLQPFSNQSYAVLFVLPLCVVNLSNFFSFGLRQSLPEHQVSFRHAHFLFCKSPLIYFEPSAISFIWLALPYCDRDNEISAEPLHATKESLNHTFPFLHQISLFQPDNCYLCCSSHRSCFVPSMAFVVHSFSRFQSRSKWLSGSFSSFM